MSDDTEIAARKAKADRLREQIKKLIRPQANDAGGAEDDAPESPHDFVRRRMRELGVRKNQDAE
jgi:hypothetical protein